MMKILRYVMMAALVLGISGVAHAFSWTLQDPTSTDSPFFVIQPGQPVTFGFANCDIWFEGTQYTGCAVGFNDSDQTLTTINFTFDNTEGLGGAPAECSSDAFSDINCGAPADGVYSLSFQDACGSNSCGIDPYHFIVLLENGVPGGDFPDVAAVANPTPEPNSLLLALSGLGPLGYLVRRRRKASSH
jgi:hypothetical protein